MYTQHARSGAAAETSYRTSEVRAGGPGEQPHIRGAAAQEGREELSTFKVRRGDLVQGKEQRLCFAGAAVKR